jgi:hypothetical protein
MRRFFVPPYGPQAFANRRETKAPSSRRTPGSMLRRLARGVWIPAFAGMTCSG